MRSFVWLLLGVLVLLLLVWRGQRRMIYFPFGDAGPVEDSGLPRGENVTLPTDDGLTLGAWFVPARPGPAAFTVIVFNGNGGNRSLRVPLATALSRAGFAVLLFDYRGYGGNPGRPTERGLAADARAAHAYVAGRADLTATRVVYFGESLGAAVAVDLAVRHPPAALVLRSPFTSLAEIGQHHYPILPVRYLLWDRFASADQMEHLRCPVLFVAGDRDRIVPLEFTRRLYDAAREPKRLVIVTGADHNDYELLAGSQLMSAMVDFVASLPSAHVKQ